MRQTKLDNLFSNDGSSASTKRKRKTSGSEAVEGEEATTSRYVEAQSVEIDLDSSGDLFVEIDSLISTETTREATDVVTALGTDLKNLFPEKAAVAACEPLCARNANSVALFRIEGGAPRIPLEPYPTTYIDAWDADHVRLPCSPHSLYPSENGDELQPRWELMLNALRAPITTPAQLCEAILSYNRRYADRWNFGGLRKLLEQEMIAEEREVFFGVTLPAMTACVCDMPSILTQPVPLLKIRSNKSLFLSQHQLLCILCGAFFCAYPRRNATATRKSRGEYDSYNEINFCRLFASRSSSNVEKLKCLLHYFQRQFACDPQDLKKHVVSFERRRDPKICYTEGDDYHSKRWLESDAKLPRLHVTARGTIEDTDPRSLQIDFANSYIGGGVLGQGCVQEEIRFMLSPECIAACLFCERMKYDEAIVITGVERFSDYEGYASSFIWDSPHVDTAPVDSLSRRLTTIVAIDACGYGRSVDGRMRQYETERLERELVKAFTGFSDCDKRTENWPIATGNWGCGAFGGDVQLKAILQLMVAASVGRDVIYYTFNDFDLMRGLHEVHGFLSEKTVGEIYQLLLKYNQDIIRPWIKRGNTKEEKCVELFEFIKRETQPINKNSTSVHQSMEF